MRWMRFSLGLLVTTVAALAAAAVLAGNPNEIEVKPQQNPLDKDTLYDKEGNFRPDSKVWVMDFIFKPPRLIAVDVPGRGRRVCWYLWYQVVNRTGAPRTFIPDFELVTLDYPAKVRRLILSNTYAYNMATMREKMEGHIVPLLIRLLGVRRFVKLVISQGLKQIPKERAEWVANLIARTWGEADPKSIELAWREAMAFDSRSRLHEIRCPTLVIAGSDDNAVPMHHATMLHDGIAGSKLVVIAGADHALMWTRPDEWVEKVSEFLDS